MSEKTEAIQTKLTQSVIDALTNTPGEWTQPWQGVSGMPHNPQTGTIYSGGNMMTLAIMSPDPADPRWSTYKGWVKLGAQVKKGETGTSILFWGSSYVCGTCNKWASKPCPRHAGASSRRMMARAYNVFHASQVDDAPEYEQPIISPDMDVQVYREWFQTLGADWREVPSDRAFYSPSGDYISTPEDVQFDSPAGWFGTVAHEFTHWTKPANRADRKKDNDGRAGYAFEELVAELGAVFLANRLGVETDPRPDHCEYIASWLKALNNDNKFVWDAAGQASKAVNFILKEAAALPEVLVAG
jgi:antirestriction protein ArdC